MQRKSKEQNGITLVALVITILALLLLAIASITSIQNYGIISGAQISAKNMEIEQITESIKLEIADEQLLSKGHLSSSKLDEICSKYGEISGSGENKIITTDKGYTINISDIFPEESLTVNKVSILDIFDINGNDSEDENYDESKLHIGDFVTYNPGIWTSEEINNIETGQISSTVRANGSSEQPTSIFQFGGFSAGNSKSANLIEGYNTEYWRIFDIDTSTGVVTLISAGCPEYYRYDGYGNYAYISEFILAGEVNNNAPSTLNLNIDNYKIRDWSNYVNQGQNAFSANVLNMERLGNWLDKYSDISSETLGNETSFSSLTGKYENLIKLEDDYIIATALNDTLLYTYYANNDAINNFGGWYAKTLRVCVELNSNAKVGEDPIDTFTITSTSGEVYEYNVWKLY